VRLHAPERRAFRWRRLLRSLRVYVVAPQRAVHPASSDQAREGPGEGEAVTPSERRLFNRVQRRAAETTPELAAAILRAWARVREEMTETALARAIALGFADTIFDAILTQAVMDLAFHAMREQVRRNIRLAVPVYTRTLPPTITREIGVAFDSLSPHVVEAVRALESRVITGLQQEIRETVREAVRAGLTEGQSARTVAKGLRDVIGLGPSQLKEVENFRRKLSRAHETAEAFDNTLRDRRFDATLKQARQTGTPLPEARIDKMVEAYRKRRIAQNAATNAGTAAKDAQRLANRLAWENAVAIGAVDRANLWKRRIVVLDGRERPEHHAISNQEQPFDQPYTNGEMVSGDKSYGCRCTDQYFVAAA
jgi:hypothetical protein